MLSDPRVRSLPPLRPLVSLASRTRIPAVVAWGVLSAPLLLPVAPAAAQQAGYGQTLGTTPMERQLYDGTGRPNSGSILDSTNPIDLMNKIRRGTAMDDATPPSSAIDQALQQLDAQTAPAGSQAAAGGVSGVPARPAGAPLLGQPQSPTALPQAQSGSTPQRPAL